MMRRLLFVFTVAELLLASINGCRKSEPPRVERPPLPIVTDHKTTTLGSFTTQLGSLPLTGRKDAVGMFLRDHPAWPLIEHDTLASFLWFGKARIVAISGDLQDGWSRPDTMDALACGDDTLFTRAYTLSPEARLDYQFIVDGNVTTDPRNPRITPSGFGPHSELAMPKFVSNPVRQLRPNVPRGTLDSLIFTSGIDSLKSRRLVVYKPAGYEHLSSLPCMYVYDGIEAMKYAAYTTVLDNLIHDRKFEPVLVVFIPFVEGDMPYLFERHSKFSDAMCGELVRLIDQKYKTLAKPDRRAMAGISAGGQFALMTVINRPDVFLSAAGQSPTIKEDHFLALHDALENRTVRPAFRIYVDVGRYDLRSGGMEGLTFLQASRKFHEAMEKDGLPHVYHEFSMGRLAGENWGDPGLFLRHKEPVGARSLRPYPSTRKIHLREVIEPLKYGLLISGPGLEKK